MTGDPPPNAPEDPAATQALPATAAETRRFQHYEVCLRESDGGLLELGRGAMGVTYKARDVNLDVPVALKVISAQLSGHAAVRERFRREARATAQLRHPHVASVFHFGEAPQGQCFYAMEFIEGETLEARVKRDGPLPAPLVVKIARQVTEALIAADRRGLVHRDLKPGNLMLVAPDTAGTKPPETRSSAAPAAPVLVKVIDFGLAKAISAADSEGPALTQGAFIGTPQFASPEQVAGDDIDARSDIYSLGATLWFLLTGGVPFPGRSLGEILDRQLHRPLPVEGLADAGVPEPLIELLKSMLASNPKRRPASPAALQEALERCRDEIGAAATTIDWTDARSQPERAAKTSAPWRGAAPGWIAAAAVLLAAGGGAFWLWRGQQPPRSSGSASAVPASSPEKSIAVLPFKNRSRDPDNEFFTDGVQDEILTDLAKVADLKVISRTSVLPYKGEAARNRREIGAQLGVAHLLEGSVQRAGNKVRVNAQLIDARTDAHLWAQTYDRDLADVFAIQSEIAKAIADQLQAKLSPQEKAAIELAPTTDVAAFDLYSRARALLGPTTFSSTARSSLLQAIELLNQALARDPSFFLVHCQLAYAHDQLYFYNYDHTAGRLALADAAIQAAFRLRPGAGEAHLARAMHLYRGYLDYGAALAELGSARRTLPNDSRVIELTGYIARRQGKSEDGIRSLERARELDPRNFLLLQQIAVGYANLRRFPEAAANLDRALSIQPDDAITRVARAFVELNWKADAQPLRQTIVPIREKNPAAIPDVAYNWFLGALAERDPAAAAEALAALGEDVFGTDAMRFPHDFGEGLVARMRQDESKAHAAFAAARRQQEKVVEAQPNYGPALCILGLIDAGLGRKEEALREGRRAIELLPVQTDAINGAHMIAHFALIAAWTGEKDLACEQLALAAHLPSIFISYGRLKLLPDWDPLRGDPRFEKIVSDLAPAADSK